MYLNPLQKLRTEPVCKSTMPLGYKEELKRTGEQFKQISIIQHLLQCFLAINRNNT